LLCDGIEVNTQFCQFCDLPVCLIHPQGQGFLFFYCSR
jgi:hypothetical protein